MHAAIKALQINCRFWMSWKLFVPIPEPHFLRGRLGQTLIPHNHPQSRNPRKLQQTPKPLADQSITNSSKSPSPLPVKSTPREFFLPKRERAPIRDLGRRKKKDREILTEWWIDRNNGFRKGRCQARQGHQGSRPYRSVISLLIIPFPSNS